MQPQPPSAAELQHLANRLQIATHGAEIGIWEYQPETARLSWDSMTAQHLGLPTDSRDGPLTEWLTRIHPDDHSKLGDDMKAVLGSRKNPLSVRVTDPDSLEIRHLQMKASQFKDLDGTRDLIIGVLWDVSEEVAQKERDQALSAELRRSNEELQNFARIASHDLQEPLRKIRAFGERLTRHAAPMLDERNQDYLARMTGAANRMSRLINDLLVFSQVTTRATPFTQIDLNTALEEALDNLENRIKDTGARVEAPHLPSIQADYTQIVQLFQNLIGNGLKYRKPDVPPVVEITVETPTPLHEPQEIELSIRDNGIGFDMAYADKIFEVFQRLHGIAEYEGTGVGLSVCKKIVERHGGSIAVQSTPGSGTTFIVTLPLTQTPLPAAPL